MVTGVQTCALPISIGSSQNSCDLVARYSELEHKHIQLELNLKLVQENLTKAKEETEGMFGETLTTAFSLYLFQNLILL